MRTKEVKAKIKAAGVADGLAEGQFTALVSVFDNEDSMGDVVRQGAFTDTLKVWAESGDPIPVIWSHNWSDPFAHVGRVIKATETLEGLEVTGQVDDLTGEDANPTAQHVFRLLKGRRVKQFSFAYDVNEGAWVKDDQHPWGGYYELRKLKLHEVGPCLLGVNQETALLAAKAAGLVRGMKAGRVLSQKNFDTLTAAYESIGEVLTSATPEKAVAPEKTTEEPGQPGAAAAAGDQPAAKTAETLPAEEHLWDGNDELVARVAELVEARLAKNAGNIITTSTATDSSTEDETTPDPREAPESAAKAGAASARLRTDLQLMELEASLTE